MMPVSTLNLLVITLIILAISISHMKGWYRDVNNTIHVIIIIVFLGDSKLCSLRFVTNGRVCVCNATYCDTLEEALVPSTADDVIVVSTGSVSSLKYN